MEETLRRRPLQNRAPNKSSLVIRNVIVGGRRTSVRLEPTMWDALTEIARHQQRTLREIVTEIERDRTASSLTAGIRVYIVQFYRSAAARAGIVPLTQPQGPQRRLRV
ncbi:MAG TPA: ribbon-helix-helix domain-containing protein [Stellaceae bacterium]|jgi:predicted DNA-binding ribbon-helix-helix protein|nr:ribbon-helix-helix domain-containing protein [Stellaceae bacterium]